jgi:hypothetical protein
MNYNVAPQLHKKCLRKQTRNSHIADQPCLVLTSKLAFAFAFAFAFGAFPLAFAFALASALAAGALPAVAEAAVLAVRCSIPADARGGG